MPQFFYVLLTLFYANFALANFSNDLKSNSYGITGYINTPSANFKDESSLSLNIFKSYPDNRLSLTASPFNWLEASIFYSSITDKPYVAYGGDGYVFENQSYKDKGFNLKILLKEENSFPAVAIGLNDFAGTGLSDSEYIVLTKNYNRVNYTVGIGWGNYANGAKIKNPLTYLSNGFDERPASYEVGNINPDRYFSGESSIFGAMELNFKENIKLFVEYDPTVINGVIKYPQPKTNLNLGIKLDTKRFNYEFAVIRGKELSFQTTYKFNNNEYKKRNEFKKIKKNNDKKYSYFQKTLEANSIGLISINDELEYTDITVKQNSYSSSDTIDYVVMAYSLIEPDKSAKDIYISQETLGMTYAKNIVPAKTAYNTYSLETFNSKKSNELDYKVIENYPIISSQFNVVPKVMLGAREGFFFGGVMLEYNFESVFKENLILLSNLKYSLYDNFDRLYIPPVNTFPNQVRSDNKDYLKELNNGITIGRLELNYFHSFNEKHFYRISAGIFEEMYAGIGLEYLYYPYNSDFSLGFENFSLKKRDYSMNFDFQKYKNSISRISANYKEPQTDINVKLSFGEYLAGDKGYTLELSRRFNNGIEFGFFFTRTNVSKINYGEGSFDKGINLRIPLSFFGGESSLQTWQWKPLTKDPGSQLIKSINLRDLINDKRFNWYKIINNDWN